MAYQKRMDKKKTPQALYHAKRSETHTRVTVWMENEKLPKLDTKAKAAGLSRSAFVKELVLKALDEAD